MALLNNGFNKLIKSSKVSSLFNKRNSCSIRNISTQVETPLIHCVLVNPQIPHNTGSIGRTCLGFGARLHIVGPTGFSLDDSSVKRAGLDYWPHVDLRTYENWDAFETTGYQELKDNIYMFTKFGDVNLLNVNFQGEQREISKPAKPIALFFGAETKGLHKLVPPNIMSAHMAVFMPMVDKGHRKFDTPSFNLATSVSMAMWEAYRQINNPSN